MELENKKLRDKFGNLAKRDDVCDAKKIDSLEEPIEEHTNRQLRKTIIVKNVPKVKNENWAKTTEILATIIADTIDDVTIEGAHNLIERAHREPANERRNERQHIFAAIYNWKLSEDLK